MTLAFNDIRFAVRGLRRSPLFAIVAILSLALGIGANTAIFTLIDQILLRKLPVKAPDELVMLYQRARTTAATWARGCTRIRFTRTFSSAPSRWPKCCAGGWRRRRSASTTRPSGVEAEMVSGNFFSMLGVKPAIGRVFNSQEDDQVYQGHPVVVLSYDYWVRRFARDPERRRQEDPRQQLSDDDRRRVGGRLLRASIRRSRRRFACRSR